MIRATIWTVGLFGAGATISGMFTSGWSQPLVLIVLGMVFLFVSRSTAATAPAAQPRAAAPDVVAKMPARPVAAKPAAAAMATVPVEQSA